MAGSARWCSLGHGLLVAFFLMTTAVAAAAFWRTQSRLFRLPTAGIMAYLSGVLVLCKTASALTYGAALMVLVRFTRPQLQLRVAMLLVAFALLYPTLRAGDLVPTKFMLGLAQSVSAERAESLKVRFDNEDQLLDRAWQRFMFGWGRFGRSRVYDDDSGKDSASPTVAGSSPWGSLGSLVSWPSLGCLAWR